MLNDSIDKNSEKKITTRAEDFSEWYLDVIAAADLAENGPVRGCMVIKPYGYALWETTQKILDEQFKLTGVENAYFPLFIPERLLKKEVDHVEGFAPEVAMVTYAGGKELEEPLVIRPTSETIIYDTFSKWVRSYRDLPLLINQWANVVRWELRTRLFLRTTEFLWQEGHTVHATYEEADERALQMLEVYRRFAEDIMAIPVIPGVKSESEKFAGADKTYTVEAMMQDGKALQFATSHHLGDHFAKVFDIKFLDKESVEQFGQQTSWGLSTRSIGGLIMTHSDDKGLVLPPRIASIQVIITTIYSGTQDDEAVNQKAAELQTELIKNGVKVKIDSRDKRAGEKYFEWEKKGVPLRLELGKKDVANNSAMLVRRDTGEKQAVQIVEVSTVVQNLLEDIQTNLFNKAKSYREAKTKTVDSWEEFQSAIEAGNFVLAHWDGTAETEKLIKDETGATIRCLPFEFEAGSGACVKSGASSARRVLFAKAY